jgi:predicted DNA-binding ribbon-helix-helix protein
MDGSVNVASIHRIGVTDLAQRRSVMMNKLVKKLADKTIADCWYNGYSDREKIMENFARLIALECAHIIDKSDNREIAIMNIYGAFDIISRPEASDEMPE